MANSLQLHEILDNSREQAREARSKLEDAISRMAELETARQSLDAERRQLAEARDASRACRTRVARYRACAGADPGIAARADRLAEHRRWSAWAASAASWIRAWATSHRSSATGDSPVESLENERQAALEQARAAPTSALGEARAALEGIDNDLRSFEQARHQRDEQSLTAARSHFGQRKLDQQALVPEGRAAIVAPWSKPASCWKT